MRANANAARDERPTVRLTATTAMNRLLAASSQKAPAFSARDQFGRKRTLASLKGPKGTVLLFFRSADWCPFCRRQLQDLQKNLKDIEATGIQLVAISYDSPATNTAELGTGRFDFPRMSAVTTAAIGAATAAAKP